MKVRLLEDGSFGGLQHLEFPIEVEAEYHHEFKDCIVLGLTEALRIGYDMQHIHYDKSLEHKGFFFNEWEWESV